MVRVIPYLRLMRPANIVTSVADIIAGLAVAGIPILSIGASNSNTLLLILSTIGLYGGGVVMNDVFDAELDRIERPERAIPSGDVSVFNATCLAFGLYALGMGAAFLYSFTSFLIAVGITLLSLIYDKWAKHNAFFGPLTMGACRAANLLLGMSAALSSLGAEMTICIIPFMFIFAITFLSRGEVYGSGKQQMRISAMLFISVIAFLINLQIQFNLNLLIFIPFLLLFGVYVFIPFVKAYNTGAGMDIRRAVKAGVISLIFLDACIVAGFAGITSALFVLLLFPLSMFLSKIFAVT